MLAGMGVLIDIIVPVFAVVGVGFTAARKAWLSEAGVDGLGAFVFNFAVPAMMFHAMATREFPETIQWEFLIAYFAAAYISWGAVIALSRGLFRRDLAGASILGLGGAFSNSVMLGLPLVHLAFGEEGLLPVFLILSFHTWQLLFVVTVLVEAARGRRGRVVSLAADVLKGLAANPIIMAVLAGMLWNWSGIGLALPADRFLDLMGKAAIPCSLFCLGASLARYELKGAVAEAGVVTAMKLIVHPLAAYLIGAYLFHLEPLWLSVAVLMAATPVGINVYLFAMRYDAGAATAATTILMSTVVSVATLSGVLWLLGVG